MRKKIIEGDFAVLYEDDHWWIIVDKVYSQLPVVYRGSTKTVITIYIDFVNVDGTLTPAVFYLPKNVIPLRIAMDHFHRLERTHKKKMRELELYRNIKG